MNAPDLLYHAAMLGNWIIGFLLLTVLAIYVTACVCRASGERTDFYRGYRMGVWAGRTEVAEELRRDDDLPRGVDDDFPSRLPRMNLGEARCPAIWEEHGDGTRTRLNPVLVPRATNPPPKGVRPI